MDLQSLNMTNLLQLGLVVLCGIVLVFLVNKYVLRKQSQETEGFHNEEGEEAEEAEKPQEHERSNTCAPVKQDPVDEVLPGEPLGKNEVFAPTDVEVPSEGSAENDTLENNKYPTDCFPKDKLSPTDLLPADKDNKWAQVNPDGQGCLGDKNFLNAGYHIGVNTVGQTLRNANRQLRSEPSNPQITVSPWLQSTIEPDTNRKPLEIGGC